VNLTRLVRYRTKARIDITRIGRSIQEAVSEASAASWLEQIEATIQSLSNDADMWPEAEEASNLDVNLRFRAFGRKRHVYRILFTIEGDCVVVHRVMHAAQDWITDLD
jgi:plasmid stabilization system protein ParE